MIVEMKKILSVSVSGLGVLLLHSQDTLCGTCVYTKTPQNEQTTVPWHQDNAYFDPDALNVLLVTAWIPLIDANQENGCMQVYSMGVWNMGYGVWNMGIRSGGH